MREKKGEEIKQDGKQSKPSIITATQMEAQKWSNMQKCMCPIAKEGKSTVFKNMEVVG